MSSSVNVRAFTGDPDLPLLLSLENDDEDANTATKTAIYRAEEASVIAHGSASDPRNNRFEFPFLMSAVGSVEQSSSAVAAVVGMLVRGELGLPSGFKLNLTTKETERALGSKRLLQRLRYHGWIKPLFPSRDALYPVTQIIAVQRKIEAGEMPPLLPSETKQRLKAQPTQMNRSG